jgi:transcriptional regulator with XRE-family HTH domain
MPEMDLYHSIGRRIAERRKQLGLRQTQVAAAIGLSRASLANIETGRQKLLVHQVYRLCTALELKSILDLLPPSLNSNDQSEELVISGSSLSRTEKLQVENFIRSAIASDQRTKR